MRRRAFLAIALLLSPCLAASSTITGKLKAGPKPELATREGKLVSLSGDPDTMAVLADSRLNGMELELTGEFAGPTRFTIGPFELKSLLVLKNGRKYEVTYWCDT